MYDCNPKILAIMLTGEVILLLAQTILSGLISSATHRTQTVLVACSFISDYRLEYSGASFWSIWLRSGTLGSTTMGILGSCFCP